MYVKKKNKMNWTENQENWVERQVVQKRAQVQKEIDFLFGLTHYDWMYRATGDEKYLEEQQKYIRDNK